MRFSSVMCLISGAFLIMAQLGTVQHSSLVRRSGQTVVQLHCSNCVSLVWVLGSFINTILKEEYCFRLLQPRNAPNKYKNIQFYSVYLRAWTLICGKRNCTGWYKTPSNHACSSTAAIGQEEGDTQLIVQSKKCSTYPLNPSDGSCIHVITIPRGTEVYTYCTKLTSITCCCWERQCRKHCSIDLNWAELRYSYTFIHFLHLNLVQICAPHPCE